MNAATHITVWPLRRFVLVAMLIVLCAGTAAGQVSDVSDAVFSIVVPSARARDIDMGTVVLGSTRDTLVGNFCENTGVVDIRIDTLYLQGMFAGDFIATSGLPPLRLPKAATHAVGFSFTPKAAGPRSATIVLITQVDTQRYTIRGNGVEPQIAVQAGMIDFGAVPVGGRRDSTLDVMIRNISAAPVTVSDIAAGGPDTEQFSIVSGGAPFFLPPFAAHSMTLRFAPRRGGRTSGSLVFTLENNAQQPMAQLYGEGVSTQASACIAADTVSARAGEIVEIPVRLLDGENILLSGATTVYTELRFDASLLVPVGSTPKGSIEAGFRVIPLDNLPLLVGSDRILATVEMMATLGTTTATMIEVRNSVARGGDLALTERPGAFRLLDVCEDGGERLFAAQGRFQMLPNQPNPFNSETVLHFEVIEGGDVQLDILDLSGRVLATPHHGFTEPGVYSVVFNAERLASGMYSIRLRSGLLSAQRLMHVLK